MSQTRKAAQIFATQLSRRQKFNQIQFDPKVLEGIKANNIGKVRTQKHDKFRAVAIPQKTEFEKVQTDWVPFTFTCVRSSNES
jgi:hypothetical protein